VIAATASSSSSRTGIRPVEPRRDMAALAALLRTAFASTLDAAGRRMVDAMQLFGRAGWIGWLAGHMVLPPAAYPRGFVWEVNGRLVGNASMVEVTGSPGRWVIANVAVHPEERRKGIASALVRACLDSAYEERAREVVLQVDSDNLGARRLYETLGFSSMATRTTWIRSGRKAPESDMLVPMRQRDRDEWTLQWNLARTVSPEGLIWPYPLRSSFFRATSFMGRLNRGSRRHWVWMDQGSLLASLTARWGIDDGRWRLVMMVAPSHRGQIEEGVLRYGIAELQQGRIPLIMDYPDEAAADTFRALGFRLHRTLTWMRKVLP